MHDLVPVFAHLAALIIIVFTAFHYKHNYLNGISTRPKQKQLVDIIEAFKNQTSPQKPTFRLFL